MKTAISLPDFLFKEAEATAKELGMSRSKFIQTALESFLRQRREEAIRKEIDRYVAQHSHPTEEDEILLEHARRMVGKVE
jgi:metal-responsive CopG/Arc/MetJ family transcriptional regulator